MKVLHVIVSVSRDTGGPARSSQGLVAAQCAAGVDAFIWAIDKTVPWMPGVRSVSCDLNNQTILNQTIKQFDLIHIHGIWSPLLHKVAVACRRAGVPYVIAPRGMLEPWSLQQKWLKKRIARWLYQDKDLKCAAALHATAESEAQQFRALGFKNPIIISPNGVNLPEKKVEREGGEGRWREKVEGERRALFVSRMHKKKGVLELVEAWARIKQSNNPQIKQWRCELVYTVNSDEERAYEQQVKDRVLALGMSYKDKDGTIHSSTSDFDFIFTGALDDEKKWEAYGRADLFVLPTYSENFGIVIAEALWAGVPVITTKGTPWYELEGAHSESNNQTIQQSSHSSRCGWWIDIGVESLTVAISLAVTMEASELIAIGNNGRDLIESKYTWKAAANAMLAGYNKVLNLYRV